MEEQYKIVYQKILERTGEEYKIETGGSHNEEYITSFDEAERIAQNAMKRDKTIIGYKIYSRGVMPWVVASEDKKPL